MQVKKKEKETFRSPSWPYLMVIAAIFAFAGGQFVIREFLLKMDEPGDWFVIVLVVGFMSSLALAGLWFFLRAPFLRAVVSQGEIAVHGPFRVKSYRTVGVRAKLYEGGIIPVWCPCITTLDGEELFITILARHGNNFSAEPTRKMLSICNRMDEVIRG